MIMCGKRTIQSNPKKVRMQLCLHEGEEDKYQDKGEEDKYQDKGEEWDKGEELECVVALREGPELG